MDRRRGIGGTDIGAICGLSPWKRPIDVYMKKLGLVDGPDDNENMWWGREMEPVLKKRYEKELGVVVSPPTGLLVHEKYDWYIGSPDGVYGLGGVDYKTAGYRDPDQWGEAYTDNVPAQYHAQAVWYMGLTGAQFWDIAVLFMGRRREFVVYRVNRDEELISDLTEKGRYFWEEHIVKQIPPVPDDSPGWKDFFRIKYPVDEGLPITADSDLEEDIIAYKALCDLLADWEKEKEIMVNQFKYVMQTAPVIESSLGKITWKKTKDRTVIDWEGLARELGATEQQIKNWSISKPGPRVFRPYWAKESK